ncbi:hypothetical protein MNBD_GAMMA22-1912 [hydrothermal vent metagenome]|uniref:Uncharacterized protein n=1 Tax=hydrothermal vent metagenome TaxID=652676 RepID=A0A3B1AE07_9ZZZZ
MTKTAPINNSTIKQSIKIYPNEPLWKRVPTHDEQGALLADFMMLIPGLNKSSHIDFLNTIDSLNKLFTQYNKHVVFIDLNVKLNLLWVSVKSHPGICLELPTMIKNIVPNAILVANKT